LNSNENFDSRIRKNELLEGGKRLLSPQFRFLSSNKNVSWFSKPIIFVETKQITFFSQFDKKRVSKKMRKSRHVILSTGISPAVILSTDISPTVILSTVILTVVNFFKSFCLQKSQLQSFCSDISSIVILCSHIGNSH